MLLSWRRLVVAMIALALTTQLVQAQMLLCGPMDMDTENVAAAAMTSAHERHEETQRALTSEAGAQMSAPHSSKCILAASCGTVTAAVMTSLPAFIPELVETDLPTAAGIQRLRSLRPDLPPPRV
jgi:hypothetical protein